MNKKQILLFGTKISLNLLNHMEKRDVSITHHPLVNNYLSNQNNLLNISSPRSAMILICMTFNVCNIITEKIFWAGVAIRVSLTYLHDFLSHLFNATN